MSASNIDDSKSKRARVAGLITRSDYLVALGQQLSQLQKYRNAVQDITAELMHAQNADVAFDTVARIKVSMKELKELGTAFSVLSEIRRLQLARLDARAKEVKKNDD